MQELDFTAVKSPSAADTNDGSACESLQSLENRITALNWIVLLRNMFTERNLTECEGTSPDGYHAVQFGRSVYFTALRYSLSNKIQRIRMLQACNLH
jgi:hypothetical protein